MSSTRPIAASRPARAKRRAARRGWQTSCRQGPAPTRGAGFSVLCAFDIRRRLAAVPSHSPSRPPKQYSAVGGREGARERTAEGPERRAARTQHEIRVGARAGAEGTDGCPARTQQNVPHPSCKMRRATLARRRIALRMVSGGKCRSRSLYRFCLPIVPRAETCRPLC